MLVILLAFPAAAAEADLARHALLHDGVERHYLITVPPAVAAAGEPVPAVLVLHGGGGNGVNAMEMSGFAEKALADGFIAVFPEGTGRTALLTWNAVHCCSYAMEADQDDIGFIADLIDELVADYPVDPDRIYVTGMSNGGMMTHQLGIALSDRIAAIGTIVGALFGDEQMPASPVPAIIINGAEDEMVPPAGGALGAGRLGPLARNAWDGTLLMPSAYQGTFWAAADGCDPTPEVTQAVTYTLSRYACPVDLAVDYYLVNDNGHAWPGGQPGTAFADTPNPAFDATEIMWEFFQAHSLADRHEAAPP